MSGTANQSNEEEAYYFIVHWQNASLVGLNYCIRRMYLPRIVTLDYITVLGGAFLNTLY